MIPTFIDCETTGLDERIHQPYEVCFWREGDQQPITVYPAHTLEYADPRALEIGKYFERGFKPEPDNSLYTPGLLARRLNGVTLVGSNPDFDARMLTRVIGFAPWHHRTINVATMAYGIFDWPAPRGLADVATACRERGFSIPEPDHTAEGDVRATRAVFYALRDIRDLQST